jgi:hypothetical protein
MAKKPGVLDELAALAPKRKHFYEHMPADAQERLMEIRRLKQSGECTHSVATIHKWVKQNGGSVSVDNLSAFLNEQA